MARTPNYGFERKERERLKAEKKAEKLKEKQAAKDAAKGSGESGSAAPDDDSSKD